MANMGLRSIITPAPDYYATSFCQCNARTKTGAPLSQAAQEQVCRCGEDEVPRLDWTWNASLAHPETRIDGSTVLFHPVYSQGTSVVRGTRPLAADHIHYWEIKINTCMSGTDLMIGIGTDTLDMTSHQFRFASYLGLDERSWGYSYRGQIQHKKRMKYYGNKFSRGCLVGVYLDRHLGQLQFYLNRRPQGIAYTNIPADLPLYPYICSTSAKSSVKLIHASTIANSLQYRCIKKMSQDPLQIQQLATIPGLKSIYKDLWFLRAKEQYSYDSLMRLHRTKQRQHHQDLVLCGLQTDGDEVTDDMVAAMPDVDDIYADYIEPELPYDPTIGYRTVCARDHSEDEDEEAAGYLSDEVMMNGVHFLL